MKPVFIITSRESDYHACHTNKEFIKLFEQFYKISLEDCPEGEVKGKLLAHAKSLNVGKESLERLAENKSILSLARRPIFFTLLTKIAGHEGSSLNRVVDEFSLLDEVVNTEIRRTIDEIIPDKNKEIIAKLRKSLQEELFNCALYCTQKNVNESIIEFHDGEISKKLPVGIVTVINKSVEVAEKNSPYHIYLKYTDKLIRLIYDRQFRNTPEITEFLFEDMISTVQEIHYIKKDTFAAISQSSIYILTIGDDKVHVEKVNTAVKISGVILEEADGTRIPNNGM